MGRGEERRNEAWVRAGTREEQLRVVKGKERKRKLESIWRNVRGRYGAMKEEIVIYWTRRRPKNNATFLVLPQNKT